ncbi:DUF3005 domain-containing protein [Burkholderia sp. Ac-20365]|jgi:hypothetical protein|uniref:DUF3005 domain-containing protein n=1 Tax=Burkholderia sp. Ac-20365 TaxID=2703897 RepID=UPI00197BEB41|nr:DUF3005 domain-containing protein [Burkholderia sp. Ac-20365]MBN3766454.1 DUF3005 domain-containing protein [Burkholderia sp. Ac-20365]
MSLNTRKIPATQSGSSVARSAEMHNDRTHDSTVDTDSKNHEAARIAGHAPIGPDEITTTNASLVNSVPVNPFAALAGFDSRIGGNHLLLALEPGYRLIDKGMTMPEPAEHFDDRFHETRTLAGERMRGRMHFALNHQRPMRVIELERVE